MRLFRPLFTMRLLYPGALFRVPTREKKLYLTFDDGPERGSTPEILKILERNGVKALFFCEGEKAEKNPELMQMILSAGHLTGNHGYRHLDGWKTKLQEYTGNVKKAGSFFSEKLYRPPYGRIRRGQYRELSKKYLIVFWDLMSYDFDSSLPPAKLLKILTRKIRPGSVIVFHDKPGTHAMNILDDFIKLARETGYDFESSLRNATFNQL